MSSVRDKVTILFHCYGGVNRSGSALCAFLILRKERTARLAIERLASARPVNDYLQKRGYFVDGLIEIDWRSRSRSGVDGMDPVGWVHHMMSLSCTGVASHDSSAPRPWSPLDIDSDSEMHCVTSAPHCRSQKGASHHRPPSPPPPLPRSSTYRKTAIYRDKPISRDISIYRGEFCRDKFPFLSR